MKPVILVLGHKGMLGSTVLAYFRRRGYDVRVVEWRFGPALEYRPLLLPVAVDVVINCIGAIPQKEATPRQMVETNALLPHALRQVFPEGTLLIHPSTDCVFSGAAGPYSVADPPDATDDYGTSKAFGDKIALYPNTIVLRTSIIGPGGKGLMQWLLDQPKGATVPGWTNVLWNGITTLEWAKVAEAALERNPRCHPGTVLHVASEDAASKFALLWQIAEVFRPDLHVERAKAPQGHRDMRLAAQEPYIRVPIREQLVELRAWMNAR